MTTPKYRKSVLLMAILTALNGGCIDLVTESVRDGVGDAISDAVASAIASIFVVNEDG